MGKVLLLVLSLLTVLLISSPMIMCELAHDDISVIGDNVVAVLSDDSQPRHFGRVSIAENAWSKKKKPETETPHFEGRIGSRDIVLI